MRKILLSLAVSFCFLIVANRAFAQQSGEGYQAAIGLKFGAYEDGLSLKWFPNPTVSYEALLGVRDHGLVFTGLYELNQQAFNVPGLRFYYGFGAHIGGEGRGYYHRFDGGAEYFSNNHLLLGLDGAVGLDYTIPNSQIAVSLDLNPRVELATGPFFDIAPGLGVKYTF